MTPLFDWLGRRGRASARDSDTVRRIAAELDRVPPERARAIAAFAFVLSRVAAVDDELSPEEVTTMERLVVEKGQLPPEQAALVVQMARHQQRLFGGTDDFLVTREFAETATPEECLALVECLFAVAAADRRLVSTEADEISRIARELRVDASDVTRLRLHYRDALTTRQGLPGDET